MEDDTKTFSSYGSLEQPTTPRPVEVSLVDGQDNFRNQIFTSKGVTISSSRYRRAGFFPKEGGDKGLIESKLTRNEPISTSEGSLLPPRRIITIGNRKQFSQSTKNNCSTNESTLNNNTEPNLSLSPTSSSGKNSEISPSSPSYERNNNNSSRVNFFSLSLSFFFFLLLYL
jgi:hypothetical protein